MIDSKIDRIRKGHRPRVLDLFAGCGGLSLGFDAAGFEIVAGIDTDPHAAESHGINFHNGAKEFSISRDVSTAPGDFCVELGLGPEAEAFDVIVGGPPCQAFARVGRPKLREIDAHPTAFLHDSRARLFLDWLRYVDQCQPLAVLMENVPDVLNHGGQNIAEDTCEVLETKGYVCAYTLLNAAYYGVPQMRERMFLIGFRREVTDTVEFPDPTHWARLPSGYKSSRAVALRILRRSESEGVPNCYVKPPLSSDDKTPAITAFEAIGDLPPIYARDAVRNGEIRRGARRFDKPIRYAQDRELSNFSRQMKQWPGFEAGEVMFDHVIRFLPRDFELFARMNHGDQYPEAAEHAKAMLAERIALEKEIGRAVNPGTEEFERIKKEIVPPYDAGKFPNKWRKMWPDKPARTLMAHLGKDGYSHIHYDSTQARTISVREAARLQTFPDGFRFSGTMNPAFRQIGNAVPPLMAKALATTMMKSLRNRK